METLGESIREKLVSKSPAWSQKQLAEKYGWSESTVSSWISGQQIPKLSDDETIKKLAEFLETDYAQVKKQIEYCRQEMAGSEIEALQVKVNSVRELERLLTEKLPYFLEQSIPLNGNILIEGLRKRLEEKGYKVPEELFIDFIESKYLTKKGKRKIIDDYIVRWIKERKTLIKVRRRPSAIEKFNKFIPNSILFNEFQNCFRNDGSIRDKIRVICKVLNEEFKNRDYEPIEEIYLIEKIKAQFQTVKPLAAKNIANTIIQILKDLNLLESQDSQLTLHWILNPEFIINKIFGFNLDIPGLNFLLDGGFLPSISEGITVLIKGGTGTGKTTLALQLSASLAIQGNVAVYLSLEESLAHMLERLSFCGYRISIDEAPNKVLEKNGSTFCVISYNFINDEEVSDVVTERLNKNQGILFLISIPNRKEIIDLKSETMQNLFNFLRILAEKRIFSCYVLDSVDAAIENGSRRFYEDFFNFSKEKVGFNIFILEDHTPARQSPIRDYLADIIIKVGYRTQEGVETFKQRIIEIEKCRTQHHIRGEHTFSINKDRGVSIYSSVQSILSIWRNQIRKKGYSEPEKWKIDEDFDLDKILRGDLVKGSATLLYGPPATHKIPIGLSFLSSGLHYHKDQFVLLISLREDDASNLRIISSYPQFANLLSNDGRSLSPFFKTISFTPDYYTAERFLYELRSKVNELKKDKGISQILFSNFSQLKFNSPMFEKEKLFIAAIIEFFKKEMITSLFIDVGNPRDQIENIFDNIIFTSIYEKNSQKEIRIQVSHSGPCNADRNPYIIDRETKYDEESGEYKGRLVIKGI